LAVNVCGDDGWAAGGAAAAAAAGASPALWANAIGRALLRSIALTARVTLFIDASPFAIWLGFRLLGVSLMQADSLCQQADLSARYFGSRGWRYI